MNKSSMKEFTGREEALMQMTRDATLREVISNAVKCAETCQEAGDTAGHNALVVFAYSVHQVLTGADEEAEQPAVGHA